MIYTTYATILIFGLIVGSFLNAVIYRLHTKESISKGRSHCTKCGRILHWYELVPVFSFVLQRRKCRGCNELVSWQYPIVEIITSLLFMVVFLMSSAQIKMTNDILMLNASNIIQILFLWTIVAGLIVIFVYDLKHYLIPDKILFPLIGLTFLYRVFEFLNFDISNLFGNWGLVIGHSLPLGIVILSGFGSSLFFFSLFYFSKGKAMGFGDVKLAFFMGLLLGFPGILTALFIAFLSGAIIGLGLIAVKKKSIQSKVPFAPFLILGTFTALFWSSDIINWYFDLFI